MNSFRYRTEDISPEEILPLFVATESDRRIVDMIKAAAPVIVEGSRGVGKSFLLRVAEAEMLRDYGTNKCLPVYVSFAQSSLIHTSDPRQFEHWILAKIAARLLRTLRRNGLLGSVHTSLIALSGNSGGLARPESSMESLATRYEESYRQPGMSVDASEVPSVDDFRDSVEDLCGQLGIARIVFLFDEAAHVFRPEAQRSFFTIFRDLRCPFISCNAAVYPGVTSFGDSFQPAHDATFVAINRDPQSPDYVSNMREIVERQAPVAVASAITKNADHFAILAYSVSGNPRLLLKTVERAPKMTAGEVNAVVKDFYRTDIWAEHSALVGRYPGHRSVIDWGRTFIEEVVLPETKQKNDRWRQENRNEATCSLWVHRDAPTAVHESLRLLAYTGIVDDDVAHIRSTRSDVGTRYSLNLGCLFALEATPTTTALQVARHLVKRRFTEYGANHAEYAKLIVRVGEFTPPDMVVALQAQLSKPVDVLDLTPWQIEKLKELSLTTVGQVLQSTEGDLQQAWYVGPVRARQMMNSAKASVLEYLSG